MYSQLDTAELPIKPKCMDYGDMTTLKSYLHVRTTHPTGYDPKGILCKGDDGEEGTDDVKEMKVFVYGALSLIDSVEFQAGGNTVEKLEMYGINNATEILGRVPAYYKNNMTGFGCCHADPLYYNYLHEYDPNCSCTGTCSNAYASQAAWLEFGVNFIMKYFQLASLYQLGQGGRLIFTFARSAEVWKPSIGTVTTYFSSVEDISAGEWVSDTSGGEYQSHRPVIHYTTHAEIEMGYVIDDIRLGIDGIESGIGATLDSNPVIVPYMSTETETAPTYGYKSEFFTCQTKKSSITSIKAMFIPECAFTTQARNSPHVGLMTRASFMTGSDAANYRAAGTTKRDQWANRYDPSINYFECTMGSRHYPTPIGAGVRNPDWVDENIPAWYHSYLRYFGRDGLTDLTNPGLKPYSEVGHPWMGTTTFMNYLWAYAAVSGAGGTGTGDDREHMSTQGAIYSRVGPENSVLYDVCFAQHALALYRGNGYRFRYTDMQVATTVSQNAYAHQEIDFATGGQFMMTFVLAPRPRMWDVLQGEDSEAYNIVLSWTRNEAIDISLVNQSRMGEVGYKGNAGSNDHGDSNESHNRLLVFFNYQGIATLGRGMLSVKD